MILNLKDIVLLLHPVIAVVFVFPLIGVVVDRAWQVRQRRLQILAGDKSKIPPAIGSQHLILGRWLTGAVVGIVLLALANDIFNAILANQLWSKNPLQVLLITLLFVVTIASLFFLYKARQVLWRSIFAALTGIGLVVLGSQDGVYRNTENWYASHYYHGMAAALLMIFSLAIVQNIYQDRSNRWRQVHLVLNCLALLLFILQGITGSRSLLEIPLSWQEDYIYQCNYDQNSPGYKTCPSQTQQKL